MATQPIRVAILGMGKIARDQHVPAIMGEPAFVLAATASPNAAGVEGVPHFRSLDALLDDGPPIDAVALCTTPQVRQASALRALAAGKHVFLEKPPGATIAELALLERAAAQSGASLFASWHSRFAQGVAPAAAWIAERTIRRVEIVWREDVRVWHPGQKWIWQPGGLGVFDPGINALSIATAILPQPLFVRQATLSFPSNCATPIAARLELGLGTDATVSADFDFRQTGPQSWDMVVETDRGVCRLSKGGAVLDLPEGRREGPDREYPGLYTRFAELIAAGASEVDLRPLQLVADAFLIGRQEQVEAFHD